MLAFFESLLSHLPSSAELFSALPVIFSLIMIEGLLSVDNAMAIAAMAKVLPLHQQKKALLYGMAGAYVFRGLCLFFVAWIAGNPWIKIFGAIYLIYLMCQHLVNSEDENHDGVPDALQKGFLATIVQIEIMDLSLSLDNVVAAVALDKRLWVVVLGVFIGILALRFLAGYCIKLIDRFPILSKTAFLLVGFVGLILIVELSLEYSGIRFHINSVQKFAGIVLITVTSLLYSHTGTGKRWIQPLVTVGMPTLRVLNSILVVIMIPAVWLLSILKWVGKLLIKPFKRVKPQTVAAL